MKPHPVDRRVVKLWLLREICLFLSGKISSDKFDMDVLLGGTKSELIANDPTCYDIAYWFWFFYDDYKDQPWSEIFDVNKEENRKTVRIIGDILVLLTSDYEFDSNKDGCFMTLLKAVIRLVLFPLYWLFRKTRREKLPSPYYPFCSESDRVKAWDHFLSHQEKYVPKIIPQSVYDIYIALYEEQART